jgi:hypothetical protein
LALVGVGQAFSSSAAPKGGRPLPLAADGVELSLAFAPCLGAGAPFWRDSSERSAVLHRRSATAPFTHGSLAA